MEVIENQLKDLQKELEKCEAEIAGVQETLDDGQKKITAATKQRNELNAKIAILKKENEELRATQSAIATERKAAESEIEAAKKLVDDAVAQLEKKAPKNHSKAVEDAVKSVDAEITTKKKAVDELQHKLSGVEKTLGESQNQASAYEKAAGENKKMLSGRAGQIKTALSRVVTLKDSIKAAIKGGQLTEGFYLILQLKQTVQELEELVDPNREEELVNKQLEYKEKITAAKADVGKNTAERDQIRQSLTTAERDYQAKLKAREMSIKTKLASFPQGEPQPDTAGADNRAASRRQREASTDA
jgi:hypothetical protein